MEFFTNFKRPERKRQSFTNTKQAVYKATYDKKGQRKLVKDKEIDVYEKIQEYAKDTSLTNMFAKYGLSIYDQLKDQEEQFIDLTNLPTNLMETMDVLDQAKFAFDRQSKDIKAKFNNDFRQFIAASENGQLAQLLNDELKVSAEKFKTANMANFDAQNVNLVQHNAQISPVQPLPTQSSVGTPTTPVKMQNTQQGVNLNV